jgi:hypothetical protein
MARLIYSTTRFARRLHRGTRMASSIGPRPTRRSTRSSTTSGGRSARIGPAGSRRPDGRRSAIQAAQHLRQLLEEDPVVFVESVRPLVLDIECPDDSSVDEHGNDQLRPGRSQGGQIARIIRDIVREDRTTRLDRGAGEPAIDREPRMSRRSGSAPREICHLVSLDPVDADPASSGSYAYELGDPLRTPLGQTGGPGLCAHRFGQIGVDHVNATVPSGSGAA